MRSLGNCDFVAIARGGRGTDGKNIHRGENPIFADVFEMNIVKINIGEEAGSLGVAAIAAVGSGLWNDFSKVDEIHQVESISEPVPEHTEIFKKLEPVCEMLRNSQAEVGEALSKISL